MRQRVPTIDGEVYVREGWKLGLVNSIMGFPTQFMMCLWLVVSVNLQVFMMSFPT